MNDVILPTVGQPGAGLPMMQPQSQLPHRAVLRVGLQALRENYRILRQSVRPGNCGAAVKADAYGLGATVVAAALWDEGCRDFFVATIDEGLSLRKAVPGGRIFVLDGAAGRGTDDIVNGRLWPVLNSIEQVSAWIRIARRQGRRLDCALHVDTGMARLGLELDDFRCMVDDPGACAVLEVKLLMTHFACADRPEDPLNEEQIRRFVQARRLMPAVPTSLANSAAALTGGARVGDLARPGIALYGGNPFADRQAALQVVAGLHGSILQTRTVPAGGTIGYGAGVIAKRSTRVATVGIGYADGVPRHLSGVGRVAIGKWRFPIIGTVCMDTLTADVSEAPPGIAVPGSQVEIFGRGIALTDVAAAARTVPHEILARIGNRVERTYA